MEPTKEDLTRENLQLQEELTELRRKLLKFHQSLRIRGEGYKLAAKTRAKDEDYDEALIAKTIGTVYISISLELQTLK